MEPATVARSRKRRSGTELSAGTTRVPALADIAEKYLKRATRSISKGGSSYRTWEDREKQTRYVTEIIARELIMLGPEVERRVVQGRGSGKGASEAGAKPQSRSTRSRRRWMRRTTISRFDRAVLLALAALPLMWRVLPAQDTTQAAQQQDTTAVRPPLFRDKSPPVTTVSRGETCGPISQMYFNDPLLWPEIYRPQYLPSSKTRTGSIPVRS